MIAWSAVLYAVVRSYFVNFRLAWFDLGNLVQPVWNTVHGHPLEGTDSFGEQGIRFAGHVEPVLVLLAPLWALAPTPLLLAGVQIAAVAVGALPVFWLARHHLESERAAGFLALAYLANPWIAWTAHDAFHPVTLAIPAFLFAVWYLDSGRLAPFALFAALAAMTSELMGLPILGLGVWYWLARGQRRAGLAIGFAGLAWTALCLAVVIPAFRSASTLYSGIDSVGGSPGGVLRTAVTDPRSILAALLTGDDVVYLLLLAVPLVGTFLLAPGMAAVALPQLAINGLTDSPWPTDPRHHYVAAVVPFLVAASVLGIATLAPLRRVRIAALVLGVSVAMSLVAGPWPGLPGTRPAWIHPALSARHVDALRAAVELVPDGAAVSATNTAGSHLAARRYFYSVPVIGRADWIVLDTPDAWMPTSTVAREGFRPPVIKRFLRQVRSDSTWRQVFARDGVLVFQRVQS